MKIYAGVALAVLLAGCAWGQRTTFGSQSGFGNVVFPGTGHQPTGFSGFGNVVFPGRGHAPVVNPFSITDTTFANRLARTVSGRQVLDNGFRGRVRPVVVPFGFPVAYPVYLENPYPPQQPNITVIYPPQQAPVIINQISPGYQAPQEPPQEPEAGAAASGLSIYQAPTRSEGENAAAEPTRYLIAFKDHSIYSALAYWVQGDTLHYVTAGNVHNQVSLSLVDRELTDRLNRERKVSVNLPR